jgi:hypothetical protein
MLKMEIELDEAMTDVFTVIDDNGTLTTSVTGFTYYVFDPTGTEVSGTVTVTITEISNGHYKVTFTPTTIGTWVVTIIHATYFPAGQSASYYCTNRKASFARMLGLLQENFYIDNQVYSGGKLTSGRMRTYSDAASVGTTSNVVATYTITATYTLNELLTYKVVKV